MGRGTFASLTMAESSLFPITLYTDATPNGFKISTALEYLNIVSNLSFEILMILIQNEAVQS